MGLTLGNNFFEDFEVGMVMRHGRGMTLTNGNALAGRLANYLYLDRTFAWDVDLEKRIAALTPAQVRDALRRHIDPKKLSVLKAGDFK